MTKLLTKKDRDSVTIDQEAEMPKVRRVTRRHYSKSEIGIQTSTENVSKEVLETNFAS